MDVREGGGGAKGGWGGKDEKEEGVGYIFIFLVPLLNSTADSDLSSIYGPPPFI